MRHVEDAVKGGIQVAVKAVAKGDLRTVFGLTCAAREVDHVADTIKNSSDRLAKSVRDCRGIRGRPWARRERRLGHPIRHRSARSRCRMRQVCSCAAIDRSACPIG